MTFLNKQVAKDSRQWWSYCSEAGETVFQLKRVSLLPKYSFSRSEVNPVTTLVWGNSPTLPCKMREEG